MGKDTATKMLITALKFGAVQFPKGVRHVSFATHLKAVSHRLYKHLGLKDGEHYENNPKDRDIVLPTINKTAVQIWIDVGMALRVVYPDTWVDAGIWGADSDVIIISDLRFPNEVARIKSLGGLCVKIHKPDVPYRDSPADNALEDYTGWDKVIINDGSLNDLHKQIEALARVI
jgi:hypothetical protein